MILSRRFILAVSLVTCTSLVAATEQEAREVFGAAVAGGLTFNSLRPVEDIGSSLLHFTKEGRLQFLDQLQRSELIREVTTRNAELRTRVAPASVVVTKRLGSDGLAEFDLRMDVVVELRKCEGATCIPLGKEKRAQVSGMVVGLVTNGRPTWRVKQVTIAGLT